MVNGDSQPKWGAVINKSKIFKKCIFGIPFLLKSSLRGVTTLNIKEF